MADEITLTVRETVIKNGATLININEAGQQFDMTGNETFVGTQVVGTSAEAIILGDVTIAGAKIRIKNLDATNYVDISLINDGSTPFSRVKPGKETIIHGVATIYGKANTAPVRILTRANDE